MWKRRFTLPEAWRQRLKRFAMASLAVAGVTAVAWWMVDARLVAEARRHADAGRSLQVDGVRRDWTEVILPTALSGDGAAADRAREVAGARLDRAVSAAAGGRTAALRATIGAALEGVREAGVPPTEEGAKWAEWMVRRLTDSLALLEREERIALLIEADDTLASLASRTRRREIEPPPVEPTSTPVEPRLAAEVKPPVAAPATTPKPKPIEAPPSPPEPLVVESKRPAEPSPAKTKVTAREPRAWAPDWRTAESPEPAPQLEETPPPRSLTDWNERALLAEYVRLTDELSAERADASASGPTPAPRSGAGLKSETEVRLEAVGAELTSRGFRAVDRRHLDALLSPHTARRVALADRLLTAQTGDAARLLLVLASDGSSEVRAAAISALGSSSSRPLVRVAWELASQDDDPRVGRLAEPLRQRLR